jgi:AAA+ ATPase superfamily predicted ATPase
MTKDKITETIPLWGRDHELAQLRTLRNRNSAALVVLSGRRRIGKSSLIQKFGDEIPRFVEFQGLAPRPGIGHKEQLTNFAEQFRHAFNLPKVVFQDWTEAFFHLAAQTSKGEILVLLDEISWMGGGEPDFAGKLKIAWDTSFKRNPNLILAVCGSVSSWLERNILHDADFVGRVSLVLRLGELPLASCANFWRERKKRVSSFEKLKFLCVSGGIPKYLEEMNPRQNAEDNIKRLCFTSGGYLLEDFERIFNDIFNRRSSTYKQLVSCIVSESLSTQEIAKKLKKPVNSDLSAALADLELSGFITRDYVYLPTGKRSRLSKYRIKDNYLRFYLRYISPITEKIHNKLFVWRSIDSFLHWDTIRGLQFENLVLNNLPVILTRIGIDLSKVLSASPYFQHRTTRNEACQIDLLVSLKHGSHFVIEMKFRDKIGTEVITEVQEKIRRLKLPRNHSARPVLVFAGDLSPDVIDTDYFDSVVDVSELL